MCQYIGKKWRRLLGLSFIPEKLSCHPAVSSQWPSTIKCVVGSSLDFSDVERQTGILTSVVKKLWKTHYKILLSAAPLSPWEILLDMRVCCHSFTTATYLTVAVPLNSEFSCFSVHCWRSCTWRSQSDTRSPCSVLGCNYQKPQAGDGTQMPQPSQPGHVCDVWCDLQPLLCHSLQWSPLAGSPLRKLCC